jgi:hypothetical protein
MIVVRKLGARGKQIENLSLTASAEPDYQLLDALYVGYAEGAVIEVSLPDGQRLRSVLTERRRSPRTNVRLPVLIVWQEGEMRREEDVFTSNLSRVGCAIRTRKFFPPKTPLEIHYQGKILPARTVYSLADYSTDLVEVGIDFGGDCGDFWDGATRPE